MDEKRSKFIAGVEAILAKFGTGHGSAVSDGAAEAQSRLQAEIYGTCDFCGGPMTAEYGPYKICCEATCFEKAAKGGR